MKMFRLPQRVVAASMCWVLLGLWACPAWPQTSPIDAEWVRIAGQGGLLNHKMNPRRVLALADGGCVMVGQCWPATVIFNPGRADAMTLPVGAYFLARYDSGGGLVWVRTGGTGFDTLEVESAALAPDGGVYMAGFFQVSQTFGPAEPNERTVTAAGTFDGFLARFGSDGRLAWVRRVGGTGGIDYLHEVAVVPGGDVLVAGQARLSATFESSPGGNVAISFGTTPAALVARYSPDGELRWVQSAVGTGLASAFGLSVAFDGSTGFWLGGGYSTPLASSIVFASGEPEVTAIAGGKLFLAHYGLDGTLVRVKTTLNPELGTYAEVGFRNLAPLEGGGVAAQGIWRGRTIFGPGEPRQREVGADPAGPFQRGLFLARFEASGNLAWVVSATGNLPVDRIGDLLEDAAGGFLWLGDFQGAPVFDDGSGGQWQGAAGSFLARYRPDGRFDWQWAPTATGGLRMTGLAQTSPTHWYQCGYFGGSAVFGSIAVPEFGSSRTAYAAHIFLATGPYASVPPAWFAPRLVVIPADAGNIPTLLRLTDYVMDDWTPASQLRFRLVSGSTLPGLSVSVAEDGVVSATLSPGTVGSTQITVAAKDEHDNESQTTLTLQVLDTTAAPTTQWERLR